MGEVRLTYFAGWGLAEQTRWLLAATETEWTQVALQSNAEFESLKSQGKLMFGQLPLLEIDGLQLVQSQAMLRYVGRKGGLGGKTAAEEATIDMVCEGVKDARGPVVQYAFQQNQAAFARQVPAQIARNLGCFEKLVASNGDAVVASGISIADVLLAELMHELSLICPSITAHYPHLKALHDRIIALPGLQAYLSSEKRYPLPEGEVASVYVANVGAVLGR